MISQTIKNVCVRFGEHVDIEVSYKILWQEVLKSPNFGHCTLLSIKKNPQNFRGCQIWRMVSKFFICHHVKNVFSKKSNLIFLEVLIGNPNPNGSYKLEKLLFSTHKLEKL
jgi:hypothetical protein